MTKLMLEQAERIANETLAAGSAANGRPLAVAVLDDGGHMKLMKRQDGAGLFRPDIAAGKAWGAVAMGAPSRMIGMISQQHPQFVAALTTLSGGRILPNPGGVLIRDASGEVIGAVGVSGDSADRDEAFAIAGIKAAGLTPDPASAAPATAPNA